MTEQVEQRICIKVWVKLEHPFLCRNYLDDSEGFHCSGDAMHSEQMKVWHKRFQDVANLLKVSPIVEGLQQAEPLRMLNVYGLQPTKIGN